MSTKSIAWAVGCCLALVPAAGQAQFTTDAGSASIAGVLKKPSDVQDNYEFSSKGNQVIFVDLDADVYINRVPHDSHESDLPTVDEHSSGCSDSHDSTEEEGGCSGGGNGRFVLQILKYDGTTICEASKPKRPGWDTDPRLACFLEYPGDYILRVTFSGPGNHADESTESPQIYPYLLNVSLRDLMTDQRKEIRLDKAVKESSNRLPGKK
ncbi:MAG: hypothetical protein JRD88_05350 [Deltaproteobacteria bacterium]|jgi:hypothetical protein|nr:hypothetical protein [Deltaproteobacteria bacterium]